MAPLRRSNGASKHALPEILDDPTLEAKYVIMKKPMEWEEDEEGELHPIIASYKRAQVGPLFPFLKLPTELRLKTYRYCLVQGEPIEVYPRADHPTGLTLSLLRTCKAMHDECAQVLYRENDFRFSERFNHLDLLGFFRHIGPDMARWLKHLTMKVPFIDARYPVHKYYSRLSQELRNPFDFHDVHYRHICPELAQPPRYSEAYDEEKITWGYLFRSLICTLHPLPQLRELTLVLTNNWSYYDNHCYPPGYSRAALCLGTEEVWFYLDALLRAKPFLHVSVVQTLEEEGRNLKKPRDARRYCEITSGF